MANDALLAKIRALADEFEESAPPNTRPIGLVRGKILRARAAAEQDDPNAERLYTTARRGVRSWTRWLGDRSSIRRAIWVWDAGDGIHSVGWPVRGELAAALSRSVDPPEICDGNDDCPEHKR